MKKTSSQRYEDYLQTVPKWRRDLGLISTEEEMAMPKWKRALIMLFACALPFIASIDSISF